MIISDTTHPTAECGVCNELADRAEDIVYVRAESVLLVDGEHFVHSQVVGQEAAG